MKSKRKKIEEEALKKRLADSRRQRKTKDTNLREEQLCIVCSDNPKEVCTVIHTIHTLES